MNKVIFVLSLIISGFLIVLGLILYFSIFNEPLTSDSSNWADFSNFIALFVNISTLLVIGVISYLTYDTTEKYNKLQNKPLLFLNIDSPKLLTNLYKNSWHVVNASNSPALDLYVRYYKSRNNAPSKWVAVSSLIGGGTRELFWIHWADKIDLAYSDVTEDNFYMLSSTDTNKRSIVAIRKEEFALIQNVATNVDNIVSLQDKFEQYVQNERALGRSSQQILEGYNAFVDPLLFS